MIFVILIFMLATIYETYFAKENIKVKARIRKADDFMKPKNYSITALLVNDTIVDVKILDSIGESFKLHEFYEFYEEIDSYVFTLYGLKIMKQKLDYFITPVRADSYYGRMVSYLACNNKSNKKITKTEVYHFRADKDELRNLAVAFSKGALIDGIDYIYA